MSSEEPPSKAWRVALVLIVGPVLVLGYRTGSRIAAEREADAIVRPLSSIGADGRPDPRALAHVERGSSALIEVLERLAREGPFETRAGITRALGFSKRLECLKPLIHVLGDGCVDPELVAIPRDFPCTAYPPDILALECQEEGDAAMLALEKDTDAFVRGYAHEFLAATGKRTVHGELVFLLKEEGLLGTRAGALAVHFLASPKVALDAVESLVLLAGPTPKGRVAAALLVGSGAALPETRAKEIRALAAQLTEADKILVRDPRVVARSERALARGDPAAAKVLGTLAAVDSRAHDALVAAVSSGDSPEVRAAAAAALGR